ncbi:MAG: hypothetical protein U5O39_19040 [Gammaproteobacteria bacterium]|nr:hypothetical protein [Gammaproteobacteria bacterium]
MSQSTGTTLTVNGPFDLSRKRCHPGVLAAAGDVTLGITRNATLNNNQNLALSGSVNGALDVSAIGNITLTAAQSLAIAGTSSFTGDSLTLGDASATGSRYPGCHR